MEKTTVKKTKKKVTKAQFKAAFMEKILLSGHTPPSIYAFTKELNSPESTFYEYFNSFKSLEQEIWSDWINETIAILDKDPAYKDYTARERLLAFYYTWLETITSHRSFILKRFENVGKHEINPTFLIGLKDRFEEFVQGLIILGKDTTEIAERPFSSNYHKAFWLHFLFITRFWVNDDSAGFEKTDAAVEKSVNLAFDLVGKGALDSMIDFAKFMFQNR
ncbi:MAG: TetR family transcriptional regulator C-terminal domain-containing protein [Marinoscillum sp.]